LLSSTSGLSRFFLPSFTIPPGVLAIYTIVAFDIWLDGLAAKEVGLLDLC